MVVSNRKWDLNAPTPSRKGRGAENSTGMKQKGCPTHQQQHSIIELKILVNN